jgi:hypothetical protein
MRLVEVRLMADYSVALYPQDRILYATLMRVGGWFSDR